MSIEIVFEIVVAIVTVSVTGVVMLHGDCGADVIAIVISGCNCASTCGRGVWM